MGTKLFAVLVLFFMLTVSTLVAQRADVALTTGVSSVSDNNLSCPLGVFCISPNQTIQVRRQVVLEATPSFHLLNVKWTSLGLEVPIVGIPNQTLHSSIAEVPALSERFSSIYLTPSIRAKFFTRAFLSPWVSLGGGWAHYSSANGSNKGALQYGGGADFKTPIPYLSFRLELRDFRSDHPSLESLPNRAGGLSRHNVVSGGGVVFSF